MVCSIRHFSIESIDVDVVIDNRVHADRSIIVRESVVPASGRKQAP